MPSIVYNNSNYAKNNNPNNGIKLRLLADKEDKVSYGIDYILGNRDNNGLYISFEESF